ncbi:MAG: transposase, partial [Thermoleophilia bacterium]|nr:transposase [Thermoleophilia bacterium]
GVFQSDADGDLRFVPASPPTPQEIARLVATIARRVTVLLRRHGITLGIDEPAGDADCQADAGALAALAAASVTGRSLLGAAPGARVGRVGRRTNNAIGKAPSPWHARAADFDLHGGRTVRAEDRRTLERLCHYLLRPPLAQDRLELLPDGRVGLTLAHPWADGTPALVFGGVEFLEKLAVLIPKPRVNLVMYHGILSARARRRAAAVAHVVPLAAKQPEPASPEPPATAAPPERRPSRRGGSGPT